MKKFPIAIALMLSLLLLLCSPASADTITAMAIEINPEHLEKTVSYARILGYNEENNTLTVELIVPEAFRVEDVEALQVGDIIYTDGQEVTVQTIEKDWDYVIINKGEYGYADGSVYLYKEFGGNYLREVMDNDYMWLSLDPIECPVTDSLLFLDYIGAEWGEPLRLPIVRTAQELTALMQEEAASSAYSVGLSCRNVYVVFDGEGNLATIHRFYVPWQ